LADLKYNVLAFCDSKTFEFARTLYAPGIKLGALHSRSSVVSVWWSPLHIATVTVAPAIARVESESLQNIGCMPVRTPEGKQQQHKLPPNM